MTIAQQREQKGIEKSMGCHSNRKYATRQSVLHPDSASRNVRTKGELTPVLLQARQTRRATYSFYTKKRLVPFLASEVITYSKYTFSICFKISSGTTSQIKLSMQII